jgi:hypothetical protein
MFAKYILQETKKISKITHICVDIIVIVTGDHSFASLQRVLLISEDILTVFHLFSCIAYNGADHFGDNWAARRSWRFHYGDHHLI